MDASQVADTFLELVEKSRLLAPEQLDAAVEYYGLGALQTPESVANVLVAESLLTRFQADRLLEGRYRGFFIDHYKLIGILGSGGMGWLYIAEDLQTGNHVALKMLAKLDQTDAGMRTRFQLEARAGMELNHPNIVRTFRHGRSEGIYGDVWFAVMELVEGINLEELIVRNGPLPWAQACDVIRQTAAGLDYAHTRGYVHRDVKPANLLIARDGTTKVLDFGLSKGPDDAEEFSLSMIFGHDCLGTADYIAPEQSRDSLRVDGRSDIYSLGGTLYFAMAGRVPFPVQATAKKIAAQRSERPQPLKQLRPDLPTEVVAIADRMMAKRVEDRFATALEVCEALAPFARRTPAHFDFHEILAQRTAAAKRRLARRKASDSTTAAPSTSAVETALHDGSTRQAPDSRRQAAAAGSQEPDA